MSNPSVTYTTNRQEIENRNFLSPVGFTLAMNKLPGVTLFCTRAPIPGISGNTAKQVTRFNTIPLPPDEIDYSPLVVDFMIDENMKNYTAVHYWLRGIAGTVSTDEYDYSRYEIPRNINIREMNVNNFDRENQERSSATLLILSSNYKPVCEVSFYDIFPTAVGTLSLDAGSSDISYLVGQATFAYSYYDIKPLAAARATDTTI